ncbi:hypothetical protein GYA13_00335 [Candidatus Kuenenbacteria bacterium]|nr:hypothetical protein [Candidatus Kuenenbacteria bacterium]
MLSSAAFCPHPPLSVPAIGQANLAALATTLNSFQKLNLELLALKPDTLILISPQHQKKSAQLIINSAPQYLGSLENFGDLATKIEFSSDPDLLSALQKTDQQLKNGMNFIFEAEPALDYGATIPLYHLAKNLIGVKLLVLYPPADAPLSYNLELGKILQKVLKNSEKKIALIASGDLSHKLSEDSPVGVSPRAKEFDHTLIQMLKHKKIAELIALDPALSIEAEECALGPLTLLLGILYRVPYAPKVLSYEHPFGIGYLTMKMELK